MLGRVESVLPVPIILNHVFVIKSTKLGLAFIMGPFSHYCHFIVILKGEAVEGGLYLLWTHLSKFLGTSSSKGVADGKFVIWLIHLIILEEYLFFISGAWQGSGSASHDSIDQLHKDSSLCLNDVFFCKIDEVSKINGKRDGYIEGLIR